MTDASDASVPESCALRVDSVDAAEAAPLRIRKRGRRVTTEPPPGYAGEPPAERVQSTENDTRLEGDRPPHWG